MADVSFSYKMIQTKYDFKLVLEPYSTERTSYFHNSNTNMHLDLAQGNYDDDTLDASQTDYAVLLSGGADDDVINAGVDVFKLAIHQVSSNTGMTNLIKDFEIGFDTLDLSNFKSIHTLSDITISEHDDNGVSYSKIQTTYGVNAICLEGVSAADLNIDDAT